MEWQQAEKLFATSGFLPPVEELILAKRAYERKQKVLDAMEDLRWPLWYIEWSEMMCKNDEEYARGLGITAQVEQADLIDGWVVLSELYPKEVELLSWVCKKIKLQFYVTGEK